MKKIILLALSIGLLTNLSAQVKKTAPTTTKSKPTIAVETYKSVPIGYTLDLKEYELTDVMSQQRFVIEERIDEKPVLLMFSCNTCPYVIKAQQRTKEVLQRAAELNINVVIINSNEAQRNDVDSEEKMIQYARKQGYENYYIDKYSQLANQLGATKTPEVFLFNTSRQLIYKGAMDDNPANPDEVDEIYIFHAMEAANNNQELKVKESKSVGCSIKRLK